ncbi:MAG: 3'-5' exonuclease [Candidatus Wallbacteria bacterium]
MLPDEEILKKRKNLGKEKRSLDMLFGLITKEKQEGVSAEFIVENIMKMRNIKGELCLKLAQTHIGDDPRFLFDGQICKLKSKPSARALFSAPSYCVTDIETTGLSPKTEAIIELAAVKIINDQVTETFCSFVNPDGREISPEITKITGITNEMVANAPALEEVIPRFLDFIGDSVFVAHNAPFDLSFINRYLTDKYSQKLVNPIICTVKLAKMMYPNLESHSLESLIRFFKIKVDNRHRALDDAKACGVVLVKLLQMMRQSGALKQ